MSDDDASRQARARAELRQFRIDKDWSQAGLAHRVGINRSQINKIESGKTRFTEDMADRIDRALRTGRKFTELVSGRSNLCPYPGLAAFDRTQARWFHGRQQVTAELIRQLSERLGVGGPLAVVAPCGAGKSSLLAAGLIPALTSGRLPGSRTWLVVQATPGRHPLAALVELLGKLTGAQVDATTADSARFVAWLTEVAEVLPRETPTSARVVLIIDQFEETFTECQDAAERQEFIAALSAAATSPVALVVLGLRAGFYERCLEYDGLRDSFPRGHLALGPMNAAQLREAITKPAADEGLILEPQLVEQLLQDLDASTVLDNRDSLPLLAHTLRACWHNRDDRTLTVAGYRATGGIADALEKTAEDAYFQLSESEQQVACQILLRLVDVGDQRRGDIERCYLRTKLISELPGSSEAIDTVLRIFNQTQLITVNNDHISITHEALLRAWPRLTKWISAEHIDRPKPPHEVPDSRQIEPIPPRPQPDLAPRITSIINAVMVLSVLVVSFILRIFPGPIFLSPTKPPISHADVLCSGSGVKRSQSQECVGVTDGTVTFAPELGLRATLEKIKKENEAVVRRGTQFVSIGYVVPLPTSPDSDLLISLRHELQGAYLAQWRANHDDGLGDIPLIRLLVVNVGNEAKQQSGVIPDVVQSVTDPANRLVAVAGMGQSLETTKQAIQSLSKAGIPMIASRLTADDLSVTPGKPLSGLFRISPPNSAETAVAGRELKSESTLMVQDTNPRDAYTTSLAEQFIKVFTTPPTMGALLDSETYDGSRRGVENRFVQMMASICAKHPAAIYYAGRGTNLPGFLAALAGRPCQDFKIKLFTGDDAVELAANLRQQLADGNQEGIAANLRANIMLQYTGLAHPDEWLDQQRFPPLTTRIFQRDCTNCFARVFPGEKFDDGDAIVGYDSILLAIHAIRSAVGQQPSPAVDPATVLEQLHQVNQANPVSAASGYLSFDEQGIPIDKPIPILQLNPDGNITFIRLAKP